MLAWATTALNGLKAVGRIMLEMSPIAMSDFTRRSWALPNMIVRSQSAHLFGALE
jgi:hypothetical protein